MNIALIENDAKVPDYKKAASELQRRWFRGVKSVGVTAGTSTLDETVRQVFDLLQRFASGA